MAGDLPTSEERNDVEEQVPPGDDVLRRQDMHSSDGTIDEEEELPVEGAHRPEEGASVDDATANSSPPAGVVVKDNTQTDVAEPVDVDSNMRAERNGVDRGTLIDVAEPVDADGKADGQFGVDRIDLEKQAPADKTVLGDTFVGIDDTFEDNGANDGSFQAACVIGARVHGQWSSQKKFSLATGAVIVGILLFAAGYGVGVSTNGGANEEADVSAAKVAEVVDGHDENGFVHHDVPSPTPPLDFIGGPAPTPPPTLAPSNGPTADPSKDPSTSPTPSPSSTPTTIAPSNDPTPAPSPSPTEAPFLPFAFGEELYTTNADFDIQVSTGLSVKLVAETGRRVQYRSGDESNIRFHAMMDGAGIISRPDGGYVYVSNSEMEDGEGGVYALYFDKAGHVTHYKALLTGTTRNCGGGLTPWNTYVSCEENDWDGHCWQVDPNRLSEHHSTPRKTLLGGRGGNYESVAVDDRNADSPVFFVTEDDERGALRRFEADGNGWEALHEGGTTTFLRFLDGRNFEWTSDEGDGRDSAERYYQNSEGISYHDGYLYFVAKVEQKLFILDLDKMTYESESTGGSNLSGRGSFNAQPDQLAFGTKKRYLYFTEDGGSSPGAFVRDHETGTYYTILQGVPGGRYDDDETAGIALTPDRKRLYVGMQDAGLLFEVTRDDGKTFE